MFEFFCSYCHNFLNSQAPDYMSTDILFSDLEFLNLFSLKLQSSDFAGSGIYSDFGAVWKKGDNFKWREKKFLFKWVEQMSTSVFDFICFFEPQHDLNF